MDPESRVRVPVRPKTLSFASPSSGSDPDVKERQSTHGVTLSMGHRGASTKSPNDTPWPGLSVEALQCDYMAAL